MTIPEQARLRRYEKRSIGSAHSRILRGKPGQIVKASDRIYRVTSDGNFLRGYISKADDKFYPQKRVRNHAMKEQP